MFKSLILKFLGNYIIKGKYLDITSGSKYLFKGKNTFCIRIFDGYYFVSNSLIKHFKLEHLKLKSLLIPYKKIKFYEYLVKEDKRNQLTLDFYKRADKKWQFTTNILFL